MIQWSSHPIFKMKATYKSAFYRIGSEVTFAQIDLCPSHETWGSKYKITKCFLALKKYKSSEAFIFVLSYAPKGHQKHVGPLFQCLDYSIFIQNKHKKCQKVVVFRTASLPSL